MKTLEEIEKPYSRAIVKLLRGPVESSASVWEDIINYQVEIQDYIGQIGLELIVKKDDGFAFVKQFEDSEGKTLGLVIRRQIGFETSIVLMVLRQSLEEFDSNPSQLATEKFISDTEIKEELELFLQEGYNKLKFQQDLNKYIKQAEDLGYLKEVNGNDDEKKYKIQRIIKEKITLDMLDDFKKRLEEYAESV